MTKENQQTSAPATLGTSGSAGTTPFLEKLIEVKKRGQNPDQNPERLELTVVFTDISETSNILNDGRLVPAPPPA
jgi:hypothetical protein